MDFKTLSLDDKIRLFNGDGNWRTYCPDSAFPQITMSDGPNGLRLQKGNNYALINKSLKSTCYPCACTMAASWDKNLLHDEGITLGLEARKHSVNLLLGPAMNLKRNPFCGRNFEYYSEDPLLSGVLSSEYVKGVEETGTGACIKHFAVNSQEAFRQSENNIVDLRTLHELYLYGFELAVKNGKPSAVMTSYNRVNGKYASESDFLLTETLRNRWNYKGLTVSDWGACINPEKSIKAGLNLSMPSSHGLFEKELKKALEEKRIGESEISGSVEKIYETAVRLNDSERKNKTDENLITDFHEKSLEFAINSAVLLKNENVLPLEKENDVLIISPEGKHVHFQGGGSSHINTEKYLTLKDALKLLGFNVHYASKTGNAVRLSKKAASKNWKIIFMTGLEENEEGEGFDRTELFVKKSHRKFFEKIYNAAKKINPWCTFIALTFAGSPFRLGFEEKLNGILHMYLPGESWGEAAALLLSGKANPSGKLPETFPLSEHDFPSHIDQSGKSCNVEFNEGLFTGYRHYETKNIPVQFCFGHGLSYTTFKYSSFDVPEKIVDQDFPFYVSVRVKNTGKADGAEVIQIYAENPSDGFRRPVKVLAGFEKVFLEKGKSKTVRIKIEKRAFCFFSVLKNDFVLIPGNYVLHASSSLKDSRIQTQLKIASNEKAVPENAFTRKEFYIPEITRDKLSLENSLIELSRFSFRVKVILFFMKTAVRFMNFGKSSEKPEVKIALKAIEDNPVISLVSTSGGAFSLNFAKKLVKFSQK